MEGLLLGALLIAGLAFLLWKFMVGNRQHKIATTIIAGTTTGLQQILPVLNKPELQKDLAAGAEYYLRYFFQQLGVAQFKDSSQRLKLAGIPTQAAAAVETQIGQTLLRTVTAPQVADVEKNQGRLAAVANDFTQKMSDIQTQQKDNVEACALPLIAEVTTELANILFVQDSYTTHQPEFQPALTNAVDTTCADIYMQLSGKGDGGRYMGGGCC